MTKIEKELLKSFYEFGWRYITRDENGELFLYEDKPKKLLHTWSISGPYAALESSIMKDIDVKQIFNFIRWTDIEAFDIRLYLKSLSQTSTILVPSIHMRDILIENIDFTKQSDICQLILEGKISDSLVHTSRVCLEVKFDSITLISRLNEFIGKRVTLIFCNNTVELYEAHVYNGDDENILKFDVEKIIVNI